MKKYNFVYKTTNNLNSDYYYGVHSTDNLDDGLKRLSAGGKKRCGNNNGSYGKRYKWMNGGVRNYRIDLDKIEYNLSQGLKIGCIQNRER